MLFRRQTRAAIEPKLADLEAKSGIQLVVATVTSLEGEEIEPYANELFRTWKLGEKTKNNGVLLLVAPNEHKVRIEVGYGLEGTLTDALSKVIITNAIAPRFKTGDFGGGVSRGVDDIITVLTTDSSEWQQRRRCVSTISRPPIPYLGWLLAIGIVVVRAAHCLARVSLVFLQRASEHPAQFRRFSRRIFERRFMGDGGFSAAAVSPAAAALRAAAGLRGAGDEHFGTGPRTHLGGHTRRRGEDLGRDRLRAGADVV